MPARTEKTCVRVCVFVCVSKCDQFCARKWQPPCVLPGEFRWLINEQVLWSGGNFVKSGEWHFALSTRL